MADSIWILLACVLYALFMIWIGGTFFKKTQNLSDYFLGGRNLNSWVAAISAQASDMSGWLLMGLPGAVYLYGIGQMWIAVGLALGTALNWLFVAKKLRRYTITAGNAITIPQYFENRFRDSSHILRISSAIVITIFFAVYTASAFVAGGTLFSQVFNIPYHVSLLISAGLILTYTFLGGFLAVSWTDLVQGMLMLVAILSVPILAVIALGGLGTMSVNLTPEFLNMGTDAAGEPLSAISIISQLAWGLGYFGMPHILVRFMAIESEKSVSKSAVIAIVWVLLSLGFALVVGVVGSVFLPGLENHETVFIQMIQAVFMGSGAFIHLPILGGLFICGILAAIMSTADSQLLVTASAITGDIYKGSINPNAGDKTFVLYSRISVIVVAVIAFIMAFNPDSSIMGLVSNAWAGFGSAFGALVLLSLYWKRLNRTGAIAGIIFGGLTVIIWDYIPLFGISGGARATLGAYTGLYSLVPGFLISLVCIVVFSLITSPPDKEILEEFDMVQNTKEV